MCNAYNITNADKPSLCVIIQILLMLMKLFFDVKHLSLVP